MTHQEDDEWLSYAHKTISSYMASKLGWENQEKHTLILKICTISPDILFFHKFSFSYFVLEKERLFKLQSRWIKNSLHLQSTLTTLTIWKDQPIMELESLKSRPF